ncbi:MAG TPA: oxidoreductase [Bacteroidales bacterium]|nr:MAG: hypothetical protein A2X11_09885 [Bacteroidetes bacterium GWE2_42_24]OFY26194.1 MAG: hypothetical protein A2X09_05255 [Bacteroidetes bacterium GWF2_43_11]PKP24633.1 MAG: oxidoreductase [Bacteroidetes bacterium HGW-Bacteroidetes-22]HBZ67529.1 oxidoreductase [Bacteroidales bacterium]
MVHFLRGEQQHRVISVRYHTATTFVLRFQRDELTFKAGQHVTIGIPDIGEMREYSLYNAPTDDFLEVLVKIVDDGRLTPRLALLKPGEQITVDGPNGYFTLRPGSLDRHHLLIATGTGISPFHSFVKSHPDLRFTLIHGIREASEACDRADFNSGAYIACTSRADDGDFMGRVTDFLKDFQIPADSEIMLCGNSQMILDVWELLLERNIPLERMRQEIYF